jgi:hypothetical protein
MIGLLCFVLAVLGSPFKSKVRLEAENAVLRYQLIVLRRRLRGRVQLTDSDRRILKSYARYYNETRTHLALDKDAPRSRTVKRAGRILCRPVLGGLHHEYVRI